MSDSDLPIVARARAHADRTAIVDEHGRFTYGELLEASERVATWLLDGRRDLDGERVALLVPAEFDYAAVQWGIWRAGGVVVPLATSHPAPELAHVLDDARPAAVVAHPTLAERVRPLAEARALRCATTAEASSQVALPLPHVATDRRAMIVYTSGTTGRSKGVVTTHDNVRAQIEALVSAWAWTRDDHILLVLPLHHVHGILNVLACAMWSGAVCEMMPRFDAAEVWERFVTRPLSLFMAVPTIYRRLIAEWESGDETLRDARSRAGKRMRLMVSGSAALPVETLHRWREITDHVLLERYGMTELGMALANSLDGERRPGTVGTPLPRVEVKLVDSNGSEVDPGAPGELWVRGPNVFLEYWDRPDATRDAFRDGWFLTGDTAVLEEGRYRILGRNSVDIIKSGGYKISALEIEAVLRTHGDVDDCAVVGVPDDDWGERVAALVETTGVPGPDLAELRAWAANRLAPYKIPRQLLCVAELPRNAMGKVVKPEVAKMMTASDPPQSEPKAGA